MRRQLLLQIDIDGNNILQLAAIGNHKEVLEEVWRIVIKTLDKDSQKSSLEYEDDKGRNIIYKALMSKLSYMIKIDSMPYCSVLVCLRHCYIELIDLIRGKRIFWVKIFDNYPSMVENFSKCCLPFELNLNLKLSISFQSKSSEKERSL